ncbi:undecaprenyl-diphosphatase [Lacrimispora xylanisolvens]|uniref:Undecaprenyl-diphosphatase n=1 Tax=Lacrimispora xylanisolvens TaxID=384636 RepID=A0A2S6HRK2_9FIRM|nr:phosphatase PAP2 family protein [Hungatella xylanolytica]PPK80229.1 undecaprenyl-diphosphatase [Hungatella xylanolytica]
MLYQIEFAFLYALQSLHNPWLDQVMVRITSLGDHGFIWILIGVVLFCIPKTRKMGIGVLLSLGVGLLFGNMILKNLVERPRPCWIDTSIPLLIQNPRDFSFPSGHTLASFEGAISIWLYNKKLGVPFLILALLIAFSRMYLFVHFPTDVLGGAVLGICIALLIHHLIERNICVEKNT